MSFSLTVSADIPDLNKLLYYLRKAYHFSFRTSYLILLLYEMHNGKKKWKTTFLVSYLCLLLFSTTVRHKTRKEAKTKLLHGFWHVDFFCLLVKVFIFVKERIKKPQKFKKCDRYCFFLIVQNSIDVNKYLSIM